MHGISSTERNLSLGFFPSVGRKFQAFPGSSLGLDEVRIISLINLLLVFPVACFYRSGGSQLNSRSWKLVWHLYSSARQNCICLFRKKVPVRVGWGQAWETRGANTISVSCKQVQMGKKKKDLSLTWCLWGFEQWCHCSCSASFPYTTIVAWACATNAKMFDIMIIQLNVPEKNDFIFPFSWSL